LFWKQYLVFCHIPAFGVRIGILQRYPRSFSFNWNASRHILESVLTMAAAASASAPASASERDIDRKGPDGACVSSKAASALHPEFDLSDKAGIRDHMSEYGFVVVKGILTHEECKATATAANEIVGNGFCCTDGSTYGKFRGNAYGVIGRGPLFHEQLVRNRCSERMMELYSTLYDCPASELLCSHDRLGFYRPTQGKFGSLAYQTPYYAPGVHLDFGPLAYETDEGSVDKLIQDIGYGRNGDLVKENNLRHKGMGSLFQGVINIFDNRDEDGGHLNVPGFHKEFSKWCEERFEGGEKPCDLFRYIFDLKQKADSKFIGGKTHRVVAKAGSAIVWDVRLAHGTVPNRSARPRLIQFCNYFPRKALGDKAISRRKTLLTGCLRKVDTSKLSKEQLSVLGL